MGVDVDGLRPLWWFCELVGLKAEMGWLEKAISKVYVIAAPLFSRGLPIMTCVEDSQTPHPIATAPFVQNAGILRGRV